MYSLTNHKEWFAESHLAYVWHNEEFKTKDPRGHDLVQRMRQLHGLE
jgi:hypothetical protein